MNDKTPPRPLGARAVRNNLHSRMREASGFDQPGGPANTGQDSRPSLAAGQPRFGTRNAILTLCPRHAPPIFPVGGQLAAAGALPDSYFWLREFSQKEWPNFKSKS